MALAINLMIIMKLATKISLLLVSVVAVSGIVVGNFSIRAIESSFEQYISDYRENDLEEWSKLYTYYYQNNGDSWDDVNRLMTQSNGEMSPYNQNRFYWSPVVLVDAKTHKILAHPMSELVGMKVVQAMIDRSEALVYRNEVIGYMLPVDYFDKDYWILEENFMKNVSSSVIRGLVVTCVFAAIVGLAVSKNLIQPLRILTRRVRFMSKKQELSEIPVYSDDEIGELTASFNQMTRQIRKNDEMRVRLFADISHELRTPIAAVASKLEYSLMRNEDLHPEEISSLYDEMLRLNGLVNEVHNLSKIDAGHMEVTKTLIDFKKFFEEFLMIVEAEAMARDITVYVDMEENLPYCFADPERLKQIALNLVSNALRYTSDGGEIYLKAWGEKKFFAFSVTDTGIGMTEDEMDHIFDRFYRTDASRDRTTGGSGLGMAITKGLVDAHGGLIDVDSKKGVGSAFTVRFPLYVEEEIGL